MKNIGKYVLIYIASVMFMCGFSTLGAMIPRDAIEKGSRESVEYLEKHRGLYDQMLIGDQGSKADRYADSIMLNMVYSQDASHPFESAMSGEYYASSSLPLLIEDYSSTVMKGTEANMRYTRYWHGSLPLIKVGLLIGDIEMIYAGYAVILFILFGIFMKVLYGRKQYLLMFSLIIGAIAVNLYCVPLSLEYAPVFLVILTSCILSVYVREKQLYPFLFGIGMMTCYFDFLTVETLAYTLPLFCFVVSHKNIRLNSWKEIVVFLMKTGLIWIIGYGLAYLAKWLIAVLLFGSNELFSTMEYAQYRFNGLQVMNIYKQLIYALVNPILALKPFSYTKTYGGIYLSVFIIGTVLFMIYYLFRKEEKEKWISVDKFLFLLCLIPYIRFIILNNHSSMHWFFTFRAQMITITGFMYLYLKRLDYSLMIKRREESISRKI